MISHTLMYQNQVHACNQAVDYGQELMASLNLYPQITEQTDIAQ
jgi:hypothetical protein